jgi:hypothetical protein
MSTLGAVVGRPVGVAVGVATQALAQFTQQGLILVKAETFRDADAKQKMRGIAAKYEELAKRMEQVAADEP